MKIKLLIPFLLSSSATLAQTTVFPGNVSGTWPLAGSPYFVTGTIVIPADSILMIEPGVKITFNGGNQLKVQGKIKAIGTVSDTIIFTNISPNDQHWKGIRFDNTSAIQDSSIFTYCKIERSTAQGGSSGSSPDDSYGGGVFFNNYSKVRIQNCRFTYCYSMLDGGAIYCRKSSPILKDNRIHQGGAAGNRGGAIACDSSSSPLIANNVIANNSANAGGGISCLSSSGPTIISNSISNNSATYGSGMHCDSSASPVITNNLISYNSGGKYGAGIYCRHASPLISGNTISNNTGGSFTAYGGGIYLSFSSPSITNNRINNNSHNGATTKAGGGIYCLYSSPALQGNSIKNNISGNGGGIYCTNSSPTLVADTIEGNTGAGIQCEYSNVTITNSVIRNNSTGFLAGGISSLWYSVITITGSTVSFNTGGGIYSEFKLIAANNTINYNTPYSGNWGHGISTGYVNKYGSSSVIKDNIITGNDGSGIDCHDTLTEIRRNTVTANTRLGIDAIFIMQATIDSNTVNDNSLGGIYGAGKITNNIVNNNYAFGISSGLGTVINTNTVTNNKDAGIRCTGSTSVRFNTIQNNISTGHGGGIFCNGSAIIAQNTITGNTATGTGSGGGIYTSSSPTIDSNLISNNLAAQSGGGIFSSSGGQIRVNTIGTNTATAGFGGGIAFSSSSGSVINNKISNNNAPSAGGMYCYKQSPYIIDNAIVNNTASNGFGAGIYCDNSTARIYNCTVANNHAAGAGGGGGGLYCKATANPSVRNTSFRGNTTASGNGGNVYLSDNASDPPFDYCNVEGGSAGFFMNGNSYTGAYTNNIDTDPLFVSPSGGAGTGFDGLTANWSLQAGSPCRDAGTPNTAGLTLLPALDLAGNPRVTPCIIDIGAYEYQSGVPFILTVSTQSVLCPGGNNGSATASTTGGISQFTFLWSNGQTSPTATGLTAGSYTITVTDASGCIRSSTAFINQPSTITATISTASVTCNGGNNGSASVNASGGIPAYTYSWSSGQSTSTVTGLLAGNYTITISDVNNCSSQKTVTITQPASLSATTWSSNVKCYGENNGSAYIFTGGGGSPFTYLWNTAPAQTTNNATGLAPGNYSATVWDACGASAGGTVTITQAPSTFSVSVSTSPASCGNNDGSATASATGGGTPYMYSWSNGKTTSTITGLAQGNYSLTATDAYGCKRTFTITVTCITDAGQLSRESTFDVYPNPTHGTFSIFTGTAAWSEVIITDLLGTELRRLCNNSLQTEIDMSEQSPGIYFIKFISERGVIIKKLILE